MRYKHPRIPHVPWSPGGTSDDRVLGSVDHLEHMDVVVTEKLDGENTTMYHDYVHARSIDSRHHPSRSVVKQIQAMICDRLPEGWRVCGENVYAKHSISYDRLTSYFYLFSIWNEYNECLSWDMTLTCAELIGLEPVPVLYRGPWDRDMIDQCQSGQSMFGEEKEGYVIRNAKSFAYENFEHNVAKWVRENHVQTSSHWLHDELILNTIKKD